MNPRRLALGAALVLGGGLVALAAAAPERLPPSDPSRANLAPWEAPPLGTSPRGQPLWAFAAQGAAVVTGPALLAGGLVGVAATGAGLLRAAPRPGLDAALHAVGEVVGSLPRFPMVLVLALLLPAGAHKLWSLAAGWAALSSPGAMDEAASVAGRLGGARFVEALRAHGFSWARVHLYHLVALNLRPVVVRHALDAAAGVVFLELALSWLSRQEDQASMAHADAVGTWADLLVAGYPSLVVGVPTGHALALGVGLCAAVLLAARLGAWAAEAR